MARLEYICDLFILGGWCSEQGKYHSKQNNVMLPHNPDSSMAMNISCDVLYILLELLNK